MLKLCQLGTLIISFTALLAVAQAPASENETVAASPEPSVASNFVSKVEEKVDGAIQNVEDALTEPEDTPKAQFEKKFNEQLANIDKLSAQSEALYKESKEFKDERRASLQLRGIQRSLDMFELYSNITELTKSAAEEGLDVVPFISQLVPRMMPIGPKIRRAIANKEQEISTKLTDIKLNSNEGIKIFRDRHEFIDLALGTLSDHVVNLEKLGLDNNDSRHFLVEELERRAESLAGQAKLISSDLSRINESMSENGKSNMLVDSLAYGNERFQILIISLNKTIGLMNANQVEATRYQQEVIEFTGKITADILNPQVFKGLLHKWWLSMLDYLAVNSANLIFNSVIFFAVVFIFVIFSRLVHRVAYSSLQSKKINLSSLMRDMLAKMISRVIMLFGVLIALEQVGFSLGPILAGLGVIGFIVGFALQDSLGNFASGMMILVYRPYDVGDIVEAGGAFGTVKSMSLVSTTILTFDNQTLVIPNTKIWGDVIKNVTQQTERRVDMVFGCAYSDDVRFVEKVLIDIVTQHEKVLKYPEPIIKLHTLNDSSVDFIVRPWVKTGDYWDVYWDITREVKIRFDDEGISIPFPQREVHVHNVS